MSDLFRGLCDDAAIFPPGNKPLPNAVVDHVRHTYAAHAGLVGPLVLSAAALDEIHEYVDDLEPGSLSVTPVASVADLRRALAVIASEPALTLAAVEVPFPAEVDVAEGSAQIASVLADGLGDAAAHTDIYVEVPRDERRSKVIAELARRGWLAKLRTGGVRADLYPDEQELAEAIHALVAAGVPFKATAGLHHAIRNTDPQTGFEQHGFLNLLAATAAAREGADVDAIRAALAQRDGARVAQDVGGIPGDEAREAFRSFGTCSIDEPVDELRELGLLTDLP